MYVLFYVFFTGSDCCDECLILSLHNRTSFFNAVDRILPLRVCRLVLAHLVVTYVFDCSGAVYFDGYSDRG